MCNKYVKVCISSRMRYSIEICILSKLADNDGSWSWSWFLSATNKMSVSACKTGGCGRARNVRARRCRVREFRSIWQQSGHRVSSPVSRNSSQEILPTDGRTLPLYLCVTENPKVTLRPAFNLSCSCNMSMSVKRTHGFQ